VLWLTVFALDLALDLQHNCSAVNKKHGFNRFFLGLND